MTTESTAPVSEPLLDVKLVLARLDARLALLRGWLSHDHLDEPYWFARRTTAPQAQRERLVLRGYANLIHVARATSRGRIHGTRFANLDEQTKWLESSRSTLVALREGKLAV